MSDEGATTEYGTWSNYTNRNLPEDTVAECLVDQADAYDVAAATTEYREAINAALPAGACLAGNNFYGPYPRPDNYVEQIREAIGKVDLYAILEQHERPRFTVKIEAGNVEDPSIWQAVHPAETVTGDSARKVAEDTADQQNVVEDGLWRVRVWEGADADTGVEPAAEFLHDGAEDEVTTDYGTLTDYATGAPIRPATADEHATSLRAAQEDDGIGVFHDEAIHPRPVYVAGGPESLDDEPAES